MISRKNIESAMYEAMKFAATRIPPDVQQGLDRVLADESDPVAKEHMTVSFENFRLAGQGKGLVCGDTGYPLYYVKINPDVSIEGGMQTIYDSAAEATRKATDDAFLRPTMVDPLTRDNPGQNVGRACPRLKSNWMKR